MLVKELIVFNKCKYVFTLYEDKFSWLCVNCIDNCNML